MNNRTRIKIFDSHDEDVITSRVNYFLNHLKDEKLELVSIEYKVCSTEHTGFHCVMVTYLEEV